MAIYDPPDGSTDPRPRCTGHCCRGFSLEYPYTVVLEEFEKWKSHPSDSQKIPDIETIANMLVPLGVFRSQELFTCKHLVNNENCGIYTSRPQMCRDFPGPNPCKYRNCSSHGHQPVIKKIINWLRD